MNIHTGLFVERSPRRYGFMHLTFEEYYAARNLVAVLRKAPQLIREHLHDPRWDEPILLALGFVGLDFPDQAIELLETAILAQGEEAEELGFTPSPYEAILGRDYLFALRCLADQIPADPILVKQLMRRLADELLRRAGSARFQRYRQALEARLAHLKGSLGVTDLVAALIDGLSDTDENVRLQAVRTLAELASESFEAVEALRGLLSSADESVRVQAATSLAELTPQLPEAVEALRGLLSSADESVRVQAATSLAKAGQAYPEVIEALREGVSQAAHWALRRDCANSLARVGKYEKQTADTLLTGLIDNDNDVRTTCAEALAILAQRNAESTENIVNQLIEALEDPRFGSVDHYERRTGHDYAFDSLWILVSGEHV